MSQCVCWVIGKMIFLISIYLSSPGLCFKESVESTFAGLLKEQ